MWFVLSGPTPPELAMMFPTPPSHENTNNALSPGVMTDTLTEHTYHPDISHVKLEACHHIEEPFTTKVNHRHIYFRFN